MKRNFLVTLSFGVLMSIFSFLPATSGVKAAGSCSCYNLTTRLTSAGSCASNGNCVCPSGSNVSSSSCTIPTKPTPAPTKAPSSGPCPAGTKPSGCLDHYDGRQWICDCYPQNSTKGCINEYADCSNGNCVGTYACNGPLPTKPPVNSTPNPTPIPISAKCQSVKIYSPNWTPITTEEYLDLPVKSKINFCVAGSTSAGSFDKGRITYNAGTVSQSVVETTTVRPGSADYCAGWTIPNDTLEGNVLTVQGEVHHVTLGWL